MTAYNATDFDPPAPVAYVTLRNSETGVKWSNVPMQLDSGADITLVPHSVISQLDLTIAPNTTYELAGFDGTVSTASMVRLELIFCQRTFRGQFLLIEQSWGILGRNVLNNVSLLFNGPKLVWQEHQ